MPRGLLGPAPSVPSPYTGLRGIAWNAQDIPIPVSDARSGAGLDATRDFHRGLQEPVRGFAWAARV